MRKKGKVLILGGGYQQVPLIKLAKQKGYEVYLSDYNNDNPGKKIADITKRISTFSVDDNLFFAKKAGINFLLTSGTDQPVYTAAKVSEELKLPHPISAEQALYITNKKYMKKCFKENSIESPEHIIVSDGEGIDFYNLIFPIVIKPVDSQGQRGISVINNREDSYLIKDKVGLACSYSRTNTAIIEEYYQGNEITANFWVKDGIAYNLMVNDRLHFDDDLVLGLCKQHRYPSKSISTTDRASKLKKIIQSIADAFNIKDGPLYVQLLDGMDGFKVVEVGYRIGGGFEIYFIPSMINVSVLDYYFNLVTENENNFDKLDIKREYAFGSVNFLFCKEGVVDKVEIPEDLPGEISIKSGDIIKKIENATSRIGYFIVRGKTYDEYIKELYNIDNKLRLFDKKGNDLLYHGIYE